MQKAQNHNYKKPEKKQNKIFDAGKALYFSMASFAEIYVSGNNKPEISSSLSSKIKKPKELASKAKGSISRFLLKAEEGIEKLVASSDINAKNIEMQLENDAVKSKSNPSYAAKQSPLAKFLKSMYWGSASYSKKAYEMIGETGKKVDTFVKLTMLKIIRLYECVLAQLNPQWNKVMGSPEDLDTNALTMSQKESVSQENAAYQIGYEFLRYRV